MNCDEFNSVVTDLARGLARGEEIPGEAAEHAREVSVGLRAMTLADAMEEAPPGVEARLVEEIRAHGRRKRVPTLTRFAAACALVAVSVLGTHLAIQRRPHAEPPASQPVARPANPNPACCPQRARVEAPERARIKPLKPARATQMAAAGRLGRRRPVVAAVNAGPTGGDVNGEVATEFFAVPYGNTLEPITGGQIVRIRLPRSALSAVGLPVNQESTRGPVDADVLMDDSMTMRAIRFVQ